MDTLWIGLCLPLLGTTLGAAGVFFCKGTFQGMTQRALNGIAAGIMIAASVWSLLIPALEHAEGLGRFRFLPVLLGFWAGILLFLLIDRFLPCGDDRKKGSIHSTAMTVLAVTLHNLPEGMAVGVVLAGSLAGMTDITLSTVLTLCLGIAIQNIPEGAIVALPIHADGKSKGRAFLYGLLSGIVEPLGAVLALVAASAILSALPFLLSFAAGAMVCVVLEELLPDLRKEGSSHTGTLFFTIGFSIMMILDVALGG